MMNRTRAEVLMGVLSIGIAALTVACVPDFTHIHCDADVNCPEAQTCGLTHVCVNHCALECGNAGLVCSFHTGAAACECPPNLTATFHVVFGVDAGGIAPNGVTTPPECSYPQLDVALAVASTWAAAHPDGGATVTAPAGAVPSAAIPLTIPSGVTLDVDTPGPGQYLLLEDTRPASGSPWAVELSAGATLADAKVTRTGSASTAAALSAHCTSGAAAHVRSVVLGGDGGGFQVGIAASGGCSLEGSGVEVRRALIALQSGSGSRITLDGGTLAENVLAGVVDGGVLELAYVQISGTLGIVVAPTGTVRVSSSSFTRPAGQSPASPDTFAVYQLPDDAGLNTTLVELRDLTIVGAGVIHAHDATVQLSGITASQAPSDCVNVRRSQLVFGGGTLTRCAGDGVQALSGSGLTLDHVTVNMAQMNGVNIVGSTLRLNTGTITGAGVNGVSLSGNSTAALTALTIQQSGGGGLSAVSSAFTLEGPADLSTNAVGVIVDGSTATMNKVTLSNNASGVLIYHSLNRTTRLTNSSLSTQNSSNPLLELSKSLASTSVPTLVIDKTDFSGGTGVVITQGNDFIALLSNSTFRGSAKSGLAVTLSPGSTLMMDGNSLYNNAVGGMLLDGIRVGPVQQAKVELTNNKFFDNQANQLSISLNDAAFALSSATDCTTGNQFYCYSSDPALLITSTLNGIFDASHETFANSPQSSADCSSTLMFVQSICPAKAPPPTCRLSLLRP